MYVMSMYSTYYPNFRSDIDMNYKESSLNLQPTQDLMNQAYKVSDVPLTKKNSIVIRFNAKMVYLFT